MRILIWILVLAVIGFLAYNLFFKSLTDEEKQVKELETKFNTALSQFVRAVRTTAEIAMATTSDAEDAVRRVKQVKTDLEQLRKRLNEEAAIKRAQKLEEKIKEFYKKNELLN